MKIRLVVEAEISAARGESDLAAAQREALAWQLMMLAGREQEGRFRALVGGDSPVWSVTKEG